MDYSQILKDIELRLQKIEDKISERKTHECSIEINQNFLFTIITLIIIYYLVYN